MDTTVIDLCASIFDWAKFRRTKGAVKLHVVLDHDGLLPCFAQITEGKASDLVMARSLEFPAGAVVVFDRAYIDYEWFRRLTKQGVWFVTRTKRKMQYRVLEDRPIPKNRNVVRDQTVELVKADWYRFEPVKVRVVEIVTDDGERIEFLTNHFTFGATTIAEIYRQRWQIELLFKALKQNLRIKTFVGTSSNALHTQIWAALIALVLARSLQFRARFGWCLSTLLAMLRLQLFTHRDLWKWLDDPGAGPPALEPTAQLALAY